MIFPLLWLVEKSTRREALIFRVVFRTFWKILEVEKNFSLVLSFRKEVPAIPQH